MAISVNGISYPTTTVRINGQCITGSFYKFQTLASGSAVGAAPFSAGAPAHFLALKGANGVDICPAGGLFIPPGMTIEMQVTSASLNTTSAPIIFYS
jgi:hypothetical protein